MKSISQDSR